MAVLFKRPFHGPLSKTTPIVVGKPITRVAGWPLWLRLAFLSLVFYLFLMIWFVYTLERDLQQQVPQDTSPILQIASFSKAPHEDAIAQRDQKYDHSRIRPVDNGRKKATKDGEALKISPMINEPSEITIASDETMFYGFNRKDAEVYLYNHGPRDLRQTIGAFLEPETSFVVPGTVNQGVIDNDKDPGVPPQFIVPLPLRTFTPGELKHYEYPKFQTCHDLPAKLPVDRGLELDTNGKPIVWNVGNTETPPNYIWDEAPHCPVDADPFLPWIHDVFPSVDGSVVEFIAHNRRRCKTGRKHRPDVLRLEPQVALMQHVSVERLTPEQATALAPELWNEADSANSTRTPRYRLAPMNESSTDGRFTRFICRFHGTALQEGGKPKSIFIEETLSIFPYNYEFVSYRKNKPTMITPKGKDNQYFWTSVLRFQCPVPDSLREIVRSGRTILSDGTPTLHVDLIPIRTPPRFGINDHYLTEDMVGPRSGWKAGDWPRSGNAADQGFDPFTRWGTRNVLPCVEASGRWANLPICQPPQLPKNDENHDATKEIVAFDAEDEKDRGTTKPHLLSACVWASASFKTRGSAKSPIVDTGARLIEWIEFHLMVGFDHIYVFDNSGAHTNQTSLKHILDQYPTSKISRIEWPSIVCNNNIPAHDSTGERSSQYTAENACRTRFAPFTEWIAAFDIDEYLIPAGKNENLRDVVRAASASTKTNILTFRSSRARLLYERSR